VASRNAIAAVGQAVLGLLRDACPRGEFPTASFELYQSASFLKPMEEGISFYLYRVTVNGSRRNVRPRVDASGARRHAPLPVDLFYMLTPWARSAERQHRLLGWAMRTLEETPTLPSGVLNHYAAPEHDTFAPDETVTVIQDQISIQDMFNLWDFAKHNIQVSVTYAVRLVAIESSVLESDDPVQTRRFVVGGLPS
jgi:hypothetical protein